MSTHTQKKILSLLLLSLVYLQSIAAATTSPQNSGQNTNDKTDSQVAPSGNKVEEAFWQGLNPFFPEDIDSEESKKHAHTPLNAAFNLLLKRILKRDLTDSSQMSLLEDEINKLRGLIDSFRNKMETKNLNVPDLSNNTVLHLAFSCLWWSNIDKKEEREWLKGQITCFIANMSPETFNVLNYFKKAVLHLALGCYREMFAQNADTKELEWLRGIINTLVENIDRKVASATNEGNNTALHFFLDCYKLGCYRALSAQNPDGIEACTNAILGVVCNEMTAMEWKWLRDTIDTLIENMDGEAFNATNRNDKTVLHLALYCLAQDTDEQGRKWLLEKIDYFIVRMSPKALSVVNENGESSLSLAWGCCLQTVFKEDGAKIRWTTCYLLLQKAYMANIILAVVFYGVFLCVFPHKNIGRLRGLYDVIFLLFVAGRISIGKNLHSRTQEVLLNHGCFFFVCLVFYTVVHKLLQKWLPWFITQQKKQLTKPIDRELKRLEKPGMPNKGRAYDAMLTERKQVEASYDRIDKTWGPEETFDSMCMALTFVFMLSSGYQQRMYMSGVIFTYLLYMCYLFWEELPCIFDQYGEIDQHATADSPKKQGLQATLQDVVRAFATLCAAHSPLLLPMVLEFPGYLLFWGSVSRFERGRTLYLAGAIGGLVGGGHAMLVSTPYNMYCTQLKEAKQHVLCALKDSSEEETETANNIPKEKTTTATNATASSSSQEQTPSPKNTQLQKSPGSQPSANTLWFALLVLFIAALSCLLLLAYKRKKTT